MLPADLITRGSLAPEPLYPRGPDNTSDDTDAEMDRLRAERDEALEELSVVRLELGTTKRLLDESGREVCALKQSWETMRISYIQRGDQEQAQRNAAAGFAKERDEAIRLGLEDAEKERGLMVSCMAMRQHIAELEAALNKCLSAFNVSATPLPEDRQAVLEAQTMAREALGSNSYELKGVR